MPKAELVAIFTFWTRGSTGALRALLGTSFTLTTWRLQQSLQSVLRFQAKGGPRAPGPLHGCDWDKIPLDMSSHRNVGWSNRERSYLSNKQKKKTHTLTSVAGISANGKGSSNSSKSYHKSSMKCPFPEPKKSEDLCWNHCSLSLWCTSMIFLFTKVHSVQ